MALELIVVSKSEVESEQLVDESSEKQSIDSSCVS